MTTHLDTGSTTTPWTPALTHDVAMRLAATEYERVVTVLERLTPDQWTAQTDCPGWDVRAMAGHMLGMMSMAASVPEMARQQLASKSRHRRDGGLLIDALTAVQVEKTASLSTDELIEQVRRVGPKAARARRRTPGVVRGHTMPDAQDVGGTEERWTFGYLLDIILTRDPFMHRIDIAQATGVVAPATGEHEGVIVDDVVREWAGRHGAAYRLELTNAAGGTWGEGDTEPIVMDAFEFCRVLSGRTTGSGLLATHVPF